jgi:hypothetical protein
MKQIRYAAHTKKILIGCGFLRQKHYAPRGTGHRRDCSGPRFPRQGTTALNMPYTDLLLIVCCAVFYHRVGEQEHGSSGLLALISVALGTIGISAFRLGWLGNLLLQVGLFFALTLWNMRRPPPK